MAVDKKQQYISERRVARKLALIAIYQWQMTDNSYEDIYLGLQEDISLSKDMLKADLEFFQALTQCAINKTDVIDAELKPFLDRDAEHLDQIERAVLRLATCELMHQPEVPYKVIVNESVNLTKKFGADQAHKFVNGVLDKVGNKLRPNEVASSNAPKKVQKETPKETPKKAPKVTKKEISKRIPKVLSKKT
ncbi:MAG: transcription antitermination factor NusB [Cocleimonas sp.]